MAVLQRIRDFFVPPALEPEVIIPAPPTVYEMRILNDRHLDEVWRLNQRCFKQGENYSRNTFAYLLTQANTLSYRAITPKAEMTGFIFISVVDGTAHLTTIGVAPEHRRRGVAQMMLEHIEQALIEREIRMICLEVRVGNLSAQNLYRAMDYAVIQKLKNYYNNGEDGYLMVKSLV
jgi:ribosomal-protein-alanine N-acetyltransferase